MTEALYARSDIVRARDLKERGLAALRPATIAFLFILFVLYVVNAYPGRADTDTIWMLKQGVNRWYGDWHSPFISLLFRTLDSTGHPIGALFVVQIALWFAGFALIADGLLAAGWRRAGVVVALAALFPPTSYGLLDVNKDGLLSAACLALVGIGLRHQLLASTWKWGKVLAVAVLLLVISLSRHNGLVAALPLMLLFLRELPRRWTQFLKVVAAGLVLALALSAARLVLERGILGAHQFHMLQVLAIFDIGGMTYRAGKDVTHGMFGPDFVAANRDCYDPALVDPYTPGQKCNDFFFPRYWGLNQKAKTRNSIYRAWILAIIDNPTHYIAHRVAHYAILIRLDCRSCANVSTTTQWNANPTQEPFRPTSLMRFYDVAANSLLRSRLGRPFVWMIVLLMMLVLAAASYFRNVDGEGSKAALHGAVVVLCSGLVYALGYLFFGIADALRYLHWLYTAGLIGSILTVATFPMPGLRSRS